MNANEATCILSLQAAQRVEARKESARGELAHTEQRALAKLMQEGWSVQHERNGSWCATMTTQGVR